MCGITGGVGSSAPTKQLLDAQLTSLEHRGPDDRGIYVNAGIGLGMGRLAIVEIAAGKQPASDETGRINVVFNGEIYNYRELRHELEQQGVYCRSSSESEVIINLYLRFGLDFVSKLNGMFAIAIHDARDNSLHLIRDRMGKKPLWISQLNDGTLLFASEVRALMLARPDRTLRSEMISEVMQYGYINSPNSAFNEIQQVPPASVTSWRNGTTNTFVYWALDFETKIKISYEEALETTKELIEAAVSRRLISERPLGSFLSGGYDSTVITAYMAKLMDQKVQTYSIGFHSAQFNEAHHARQVAQHLGTNHHEEILSPDPALVVEKISHVLDQPFADSSIVPTYLLAKFAREDLVVALSGDGGDEVFGGYDRYLATPILQTLNPVLGVAKFGSKIINKSPLSQKRKLSRAGTQLNAMPSMAERYFSIQLLAVGDKVRQDLLTVRIGNPKKFDIMPPGLEIGILPNKGESQEFYGLPKNTLHCAFIGRVTKIKRPDRFLDVVSEVKKRGINVDFFIAGDGDQLEMCRERINRNNLPVIILGWQNNIEKLLAAADMMILTSDNEGTPLSLIQAGMAGLPVVATKVGSVPEIVLDGVTGIITGSGISEIADQIEKLAKDSSLREKLGSAARDFTLANFGVKRLVRHHEEIYKRLIASQAKS